MYDNNIPVMTAPARRSNARGLLCFSRRFWFLYPSCNARNRFYYCCTLYDTPVSSHFRNNKLRAVFSMRFAVVQGQGLIQAGCALLFFFIPSFFILLSLFPFLLSVLLAFLPRLFWLSCFICCFFACFLSCFDAFVLSSWLSLPFGPLSSFVPRHGGGAVVSRTVLAFRALPLMC